MKILLVVVVASLFLLWVAPVRAGEAKTMYLTFDDGPSKATPRILDALGKRGIKATFFVVGQKAEAHPEIMKRIADEGHAIGIHSYSHSYKTIYASMDAFRQDFDATKDVIKRLTGQEPKIYRFPGGSKNNFNKDIRGQIVKYLKDGGYTYFDWNAGIGDAVLGKPQTTKHLLMRGLETSTANKVIMLAHDSKEVTARVVGGLVDALAEKGYCFEVLDHDVEPIHM